jgi:UTP:GlnB (protein PII) uridylyltransferase
MPTSPSTSGRKLGDDYFLRHTAEDVAWHTLAIIRHPNDGNPLVLIKETTQREFEAVHKSSFTPKISMTSLW